MASYAVESVGGLVSAEACVGQPVYVSHPYSVSLGQMREIVQACDAIGLDCGVDARSWYFPGRTVRVEWKKGRP